MASRPAFLPEASSQTRELDAGVTQGRCRAKACRHHCQAAQVERRTWATDRCSTGCDASTLLVCILQLGPSLVKRADAVTSTACTQCVLPCHEGTRLCNLGLDAHLFVYNVCTGMGRKNGLIVTPAPHMNSSAKLIDDHNAYLFPGDLSCELKHRGPALCTSTHGRVLLAGAFRHWFIVLLKTLGQDRRTIVFAGKQVYPMTRSAARKSAVRCPCSWACYRSGQRQTAQGSAAQRQRGCTVAAHPHDGSQLQLAANAPSSGTACRAGLQHRS
jgi:hypothetical protein